MIRSVRDLAFHGHPGGAPKPRLKNNSNNPRTMDSITPGRVNPDVD